MAERVARVEEVAADYKLWKIRVEDHDRKQDDALYALERRADVLELTVGELKNSKKEIISWIKKVLAVGLVPAIDAVGWSGWEKFGPFLKQYMTRDTFLTLTAIAMTLSLLYAIWISPQAMRKYVVEWWQKWRKGT